MPTIKCEICGSNELIKYEGMFVCNKCGCNYTPEEAKKLYVEEELSSPEEKRQVQSNLADKKPQTSLAEEKKKEKEIFWFIIINVIIVLVALVATFVKSLIKG